MITTFLKRKWVFFEKLPYIESFDLIQYIYFKSNKKYPNITLPIKYKNYICTYVYILDIDYIDRNIDLCHKIKISYTCRLCYGDINISDTLEHVNKCAEDKIDTLISNFDKELSKEKINNMQKLKKIS